MVRNQCCKIKNLSTHLLKNSFPYSKECTIKLPNKDSDYERFNLIARIFYCVIMSSCQCLEYVDIVSQFN